MVRVPGPTHDAVDDVADAFEERIVAALRDVLRATVDGFDARVSPDDAAEFRTRWAARVADDLVPVVADAFTDAAARQRDRLAAVLP